MLNTIHIILYCIGSIGIGSYFFFHNRELRQVGYISLFIASVIQIVRMVSK